jgi:hypothetical protein
VIGCNGSAGETPETAAKAVSENISESLLSRVGIEFYDVVL